MTDALQFITVKPAEQGTAKITIAPTDDAGTALVIGQLATPQWQLMKMDGTIVNSRSFALSTITALVWKLSGDDLAIFGDGDPGNRILSIQATYTSVELGAGCPLNAECRFSIQRLLGQTDS
jgi:hypothetical protein